MKLSTELPKKLRAKQVAEEFGIGLSTVWLFSKQKKLTPIKVSSRVTVFDTAEVLALFNGEVHNNEK
jgi:predicted DNA-binding transcriptional regulator AlpA